jgi:spore germination protein
LAELDTYGYVWALHYQRGTRATVISNVGAVNIAAREGAEIKYDVVAQYPYFNYYGDNGKQHVAWFEDARSIRAKLKLVNELNLSGVSYWTIGRFFPQNWLVLKSLYNIKKVI